MGCQTGGPGGRGPRGLTNGVGPQERQPKPSDWIPWARRPLDVCSQSLGNAMLNSNFHWLQLALAVSNYFYLLEPGGAGNEAGILGAEKNRLIWGPFKLQTFVTDQCLIWFLGFVFCVFFFLLPPALTSFTFTTAPPERELSQGTLPLRIGGPGGPEREESRLKAEFLCKEFSAGSEPRGSKEDL